ncbi:MAG: hypothetical protein WA790_13875 [Sulfitobacter sp.]
MIGAQLSKLGNRMITGRGGVNPVFSEWMGEDISWRLYGIADAVGEALNSTSGRDNFECLEYKIEGDHEHCNACWATIACDFDGDGATSIYYSNENTNDVYTACFCPACYSIFRALCSGVLKLKVTDPDALMPIQLKDPYWRDLVAASKQDVKIIHRTKGTQ